MPEIERKYRNQRRNGIFEYNFTNIIDCRRTFR